MKNSNINFTSKNKENSISDSDILSNGINNDINNINNNLNKNHNNNYSNNNNNPGFYSKSPVRKNIEDNDNNNLIIKLEDLIKHLHLLEIFLQMELVLN